jgi:predicted CopG family antitoxin
MVKASEGLLAPPEERSVTLGGRIPSLSEFPFTPQPEGLTKQPDPQGAEQPMELEQESAQWAFDGDTEYWLPNEDERKKLNAHFLSEIRDAELDHAGFYERIAANERAYEGLAETSTGDKPMLVLPIVARDCDQQSAWLINAIMRPHPIFSFDPCFPAEYQLPAQDTVPGPGGQPMPVQFMVTKTADDVADSIEHALEQILRERIHFRRIVETVIQETVRGRGPAIVKCVYDPQRHEQLATKITSGFLGQPNYTGKQPVTKEDGEAVKMYCVPTENFLMPASEENPLTSEWVAEKSPMSDRELDKELDRPGSLVDEARRSAFKVAKGDVDHAQLKAMKAELDGRIPRTPRNRHDIREVWFRWEVDGEEEKMFGIFHVGMGEFVWVAKNPNNHKRNPYVAFFQKKRPFRFADKSTAESLATIQKIISEILHLTLQNAVVANSTPIVADPDSDAFEWLSKHDVDSATLIPGNPEDVKSLDFGREYRTMMPEVNWLVEFRREISGNTKWGDGSGSAIRTSPNTVQQLLENSSQIPVQQLASYGESFCELIMLWLKTYKQYRPYGELLYVKDQEQEQLLEIAFRLPDEEALDNFRVTLTAADEVAASETAIEQLTMVANLLDQDAEQVAKIIGPMANMQLTDSLTDVLSKLIERKQDQLQLIIERTRSDSKKFIITEQQLNSVKEEKRLAKQAMMQQQAAAAAAQGGANGRPGVQPAGVAGASGAGAGGGNQPPGPAGPSGQPSL